MNLTIKGWGKLINNTKEISIKLNECFVNVGPTTEDSTIFSGV